MALCGPIAYPLSEGVMQAVQAQDGCVNRHVAATPVRRMAWGS